MKSNTKSLITAAASVALAAPAVQAASPAQAAPAVPPAASYADLFEPIPNALERLKASDAEGEARLIEAQYNPGPPPNAHHHHHHHHHSRRWYLSHGYVWYGGQWVLRPAHHHHHHHHHQMPPG